MKEMKKRGRNQEDSMEGNAVKGGLMKEVKERGRERGGERERRREGG